MVKMNKQMNLPQLQGVMQEFEKQSEMMGMKQEMLDDAIDDAMDDGEEEEETEFEVNKVMDELGLSVSDDMVSAPTNADPQAVAAEADDEDLQVSCMSVVLDAPLLEPV